MSSRLRFLLFENEDRTFPCWSNTLSIAMRGNPVRNLRPSTRRLSDCLSHTLGPETYVSYRTSSNDPSSCAKPRIFRWMNGGYPKILLHRLHAIYNRQPPKLRLSHAASGRLSRRP